MHFCARNELASRFCARNELASRPRLNNSVVLEVLLLHLRSTKGGKVVFHRDCLRKGQGSIECVCVLIVFFGAFSVRLSKKSSPALEFHQALGGQQKLLPSNKALLVQCTIHVVRSQAMVGVILGFHQKQIHA